jgi:hypothetical protein
MRIFIEILTEISLVFSCFTITGYVSVSVFGLGDKEQPSDTSLHAAQNF